MAGYDDRQLEGFKTRNLAEFAASYGFEVDKRRTSRGSIHMRRGSEKIVIAVASDGHWIFFDVGGQAGGSIIDFVMWQNNASLGKAREILSGSPPNARILFPTAPGAIKEPERIPDKHRDELFRAWQSFKPYCTEYLQGRALDAETIAAFSEHIRTVPDKWGNTVFLHTDDNGIAGWEIKNKGYGGRSFTGYATGARKALFSCQIGEEEAPGAVIIAESAIDAISYYQIKRTPGLYISFGGALSPDQIGQLKGVLTSNPQARVLIATDNDAEGEKYAGVIRGIRPDAERAAPPQDVKDWNQHITESRQLSLGLQGSFEVAEPPVVPRNLPDNRSQQGGRGWRR